MPKSTNTRNTAITATTVPDLFLPDMEFDNIEEVLLTDESTPPGTVGPWRHAEGKPLAWEEEGKTMEYSVTNKYDCCNSNCESRDSSDTVKNKRIHGLFRRIKGKRN